MIVYCLEPNYSKKKEFIIQQQSFNKSTKELTLLNEKKFTHEQLTYLTLNALIRLAFGDYSEIKIWTY